MSLSPIRQQPSRRRWTNGSLHLVVRVPRGEMLFFDKELMMTDRPIQTIAEDLLGRADFAKSLGAALAGWQGEDSLVVALYGPWGSGKSSIKNMAREAIRALPEDQRPIIVEFAPWQVSQRDQLTESFFREISLAVGRSTNSTEMRRFAAKLREYGSYLASGAQLADAFKVLLPLMIVVGLLLTIGSWWLRPDWLRLLFGGVGLVMTLLAAVLAASGRAMKAVATILTTRANASQKTLQERKEELAGILRRSSARSVLVILDDIDRLASDEIRELFQLVKANADFPRMTYFIVCQQDVVEKSLEVAAPISGPDFLEKIVQVAFSVPIVEPRRVYNVLFTGLNEIFTFLPTARVDNNRFLNVFAGGLEAYFVSLRHVKRYLESLRFQVGLLRTGQSFEVNPVDLIVLEAFRQFEPSLYAGMPRFKTELTDTSDHAGFGTKHEERRAARLGSMVELVDEGRRERVKEILKWLFPNAAHTFGGARTVGGDEQWERNLRVCVSIAFDRYFHLAIPEGDISQAYLDRIVESAAHHEELLAIFEELKGKELLGIVFERLEPYKQQIDFRHAVPFVRAVLDVGDDLPEEGGRFLALTPELHAVRVVRWFLKQEPDIRKRTAAFIEALNTTRGLFLPVRIVYGETLDREKPEQRRDPLLDPERSGELETLCVEKIRTAASGGTLLTHPRLPYLLYPWKRWASGEAERWVEETTRAAPGLCRFLNAFVKQRRSIQIDEHVARVERAIELSDVAQFIELGTLRERAQQLREEDCLEELRDGLRTFLSAMESARRGRQDAEQVPV